MAAWNGRPCVFGTIYAIHADTVARATPRLVEGTRETCGASIHPLADARGLSALSDAPSLPPEHLAALSWRASTRAITNRRSESRLR